MSIPSAETLKAEFRVTPGKAAKLANRPTRHPRLFEDKKDARTSLTKDAAAIDSLQDKLYAEGSRALLVILQGMDCAGKSGTIRKVFSLTSPLGLDVNAFKAPTRVEAGHDFLWRIHNAAPQKGYIGIFDRSQYEDVLVVKVRSLAPADAIEARYAQINDFEALLTDTGTRVLKFMLNVSYEEQGERLRERILEPHKRWKFNPRDLEDRQLWPDFMAAYETALTRCSTEHAPWYVIPSDSRTRRNAIIARIVRSTLEEMAPDWPQADLSLDDYDFG